MRRPRLLVQPLVLHPVLRGKVSENLNKINIRIPPVINPSASFCIVSWWWWVVVNSITCTTGSAAADPGSDSRVITMCYVFLTLWSHQHGIRARSLTLPRPHRPAVRIQFRSDALMPQVTAAYWSACCWTIRTCRSSKSHAPLENVFSTWQERIASFSRPQLACTELTELHCQNVHLCFDSFEGFQQL